MTTGAVTYQPFAPSGTGGAAVIVVVGGVVSSGSVVAEAVGLAAEALPAASIART